MLCRVSLDAKKSEVYFTGDATVSVRAQTGVGSKPITTRRPVQTQRGGAVIVICNTRPQQVLTTGVRTQKAEAKQCANVKVIE